MRHLLAQVGFYQFADGGAKRSLAEARQMSNLASLTCFSTLFVLLASTSFGQEVLPQPLPPFKGTIGRTTKDSTPDFPKGVEAPQGAPNVLLILTDDVGFGASSTFGG